MNNMDFYFKCIYRTSPEPSDRFKVIFQSPFWWWGLAAEKRKQEKAAEKAKAKAKAKATASSQVPDESMGDEWPEEEEEEWPEDEDMDENEDEEM